jgi:lipopolysaccharide transport system permease protein
MAKSRESTVPTFAIEPSSRRFRLRLGEIWRSRDLLTILAWRDVKVRYTQTVLGVAWAVLQPVLSMVVFSVIFGRLAGLPSEGVPYSLFSLAALLPWQLFAGALQRAGTSLVGNAGLVTKVYFPRLTIPLAAAAAGLVDFAIALTMLGGLMLYYRIHLTWAILWLPAFVILALLAALAAGIWLCALNVKYRDVEHALPFLIHIWLFASPVAYSAGLIPSGSWRIIYSLNPLAGVIQGFRWSLLGADPPGVMFLVSTAATILALASGLFYFQRMEDTFADVI